MEDGRLIKKTTPKTDEKKGVSEKVALLTTCDKAWSTEVDVINIKDAGQETEGSRKRISKDSINNRRLAWRNDYKCVVCSLFWRIKFVIKKTFTSQGSEPYTFKLLDMHFFCFWKVQSVNVA